MIASGNLASFWGLDPKVACLNHGSYGACPIAVLESQEALRREMESEPDDFLRIKLERRLHAARESFASFLGADPEGLVFVQNATAGINAVLRSLNFGSGDEILATNVTYCRKALDFIADHTGASIVIAELPFPLSDEDQIVSTVLGCVSSRTRLALLDHVTSATSVILPISRLVSELQELGVDVLVDGAHGVGMVPLSLSTLESAYYVGNAHKWLCAPKGAGFLYIRGDRRVGLHPPVISHGYGAGLRAEFDWAGTFDPTPWLCVPDAIRHVGGLLPGGWPEVMRRNHGLAVEATRCVLGALGKEPPCPDSMIGSMASIPLPLGHTNSIGARVGSAGLCAWFRERGVRTLLIDQPMPILRISAHLYNTIDQYQMLASLLKEALDGGVGVCDGGGLDG